MFHLNNKNMIIAASVLMLFYAGYIDIATSEESPLAQKGTEPGQRVTMNFDGLELAFRWCPPGTFMMGSPETESTRMPDPWESLHQVTITSGFWLLETEVTQALFLKVMDYNRSYWKGDTRPVEMIGMPTCVNFCNRFSQKTGLTAKLPTEAQWEYACRAGSQTAYSWGDQDHAGKMQCRTQGIDSAKPQKQGTVPVGSFTPNAWGLYDMHGNVAEWVADPFDPEYYLTSPANDPTGPAAGADRVLRGGGWSSPVECCRCASRNLDVEPYGLASSYGFRFIITNSKQGH